VTAGAAALGAGARVALMLVAAGAGLFGARAARAEDAAPVIGGETLS
jgi:hypothetical protein